MRQGLGLAPIPARLEAREPPEARGRERDEVRLLVADRGVLVDARFRDLPDWLRAGDVLVVNTSATLPAALAATRRDGSRLTLHLSTPVPFTDGDRRWIVELRRERAPFADGVAGERLELAGGASAVLAARYLDRRLWIAELELPSPLLEHLAAHGRPIRYRHVSDERPLRDYQTIYATQPGSAEMPSAGRPFSARLITELVARGVAIAPLMLHTGVASLETHEKPYPERFRVPAATAGLVNAARGWGGRVVAVGTSAVRALETVAAADGSVAPGEGWTRVVVTPERGVRAVDGLLTGWHDPNASHLLMLEALAGADLVRRSYEAAVARGYLWHEFGDMHLILAPGRPAAERRASPPAARRRRASPRSPSLPPAGRSAW